MRVPFKPMKQTSGLVIILMMKHLSQVSYKEVNIQTLKDKTESLINL